MAELAKFIYLHPKGLSIDGKEFPWHVDDFPVSATRDDDGYWKVELRIFAEGIGVSPLLERQSFEEITADRKE